MEDVKKKNHIQLGQWKNKISEMKHTLERTSSRLDTEEKCSLNLETLMLKIETI